MHPSSVEEMAAFARLLPKKPLKIAEIGSCDSDAYCQIFSKPGWTYVGLDLVHGRNVNIVLPEPNRWPNIASDSFDVVVSGQTVEHVDRPWLWIREIARIVRPGGVVCIIGPYQWAYHPSPKDYWRIFPDGMKVLLEEAALTELKIYMNASVDTVGIATKGEKSDLIGSIPK